MPNRINYQLEMEKVLCTLGDTRPKLLLHACCAPCSSATLERLAEHFALTILYYNPNIYPPEEYHRREAELERFVEQAGYHYPVVELPYDPQEFYTAVKGLQREPEKGARCTCLLYTSSKSRRGDKIVVAMDTHKIHLFDPETEKTLLN